MTEKVNLSTLDNKVDVLIEDSNYYMSLIDVEELRYNLEHQEYTEEYLKTHKFYVAESTPHKWTISSDLTWLLEANADDEYEDWAEDLYEDLKDAPETIAFFELLNKASSGRLTYYPISEIIFDLEDIKTE